ncbi:hypothetical protein GCM10020219_059850 [Nonomuraea dietziae]
MDRPSRAPASGLVSTASSPTTANRAKPACPRRTLRLDSTPITAATAVRTTDTPPTRTVLSLSPKVLIAQSFSGAGERSTTASATATTGKESGASTAATT